VPRAVREFWEGFDPDRMDGTVVGLGRKPALIAAAEIAEPLLAREEIVVADFGCGTGQLSVHVGTRRIVGVERSPALAARAARRMDRIALAELSALPFPAGTFHASFLLFVLDDYEEKGPIVSEVVRTLRRGATLVIAAYSPLDQHMGYLGGRESIRPKPGTLQVWLKDLQGLCELLADHDCRVTHRERIPSRYHADPEEYAARVAARQGVSMDEAQELMCEAGITELVRREFLLVTAIRG